MPFRVRNLERRLDLASSGLRPGSVGQYGERPLPRGEGSILAITHGLGLALMYSSALGLWTFAVARSTAIAAGVQAADLWAGMFGSVVTAAALIGLLLMKPTQSPTSG